MPDDQPVSTANRNLLAASVLVDELIRCGLRDVCLSPGSRSAPLTIAFARRTEVQHHVHVDERSAAFFALGLARAGHRPVALVCTSGSAAANYHPAVMEAFETGVPLLVLGANRPPRLVDSGANQTSEQAGLFGPHVLRFQPIGLPRPEAPWLRWLRARVCRLCELASGPRPGPVHVDLAFDEPLSAVQLPGDVPEELGDQDPVAVFGRPDGAPFAPWEPGHPTLSAQAGARLRTAMGSVRGAVVVGPLDATPEEAEALVRLAADWAVPLLADPLSGLRGHGGTIGAYDAFLRSETLSDALRPDWVLSFGRVPTSKALVQWLGASEADRFVVDATGRRDDPDGSGPTFLRVDPLGLVAGLAAPEPRGDAWLGGWRRADEAAAQSLEQSIAAAPELLEGRVVTALVEALPQGASVLVASSMPVREVDTFLRAGRPDLRWIANRGVSGIDGLVSTTLGIAAAGSPTFGLLGDLALLHDLGGLAAARRLGLRAVIVVINNGGGGIFSYLPVAQTDAPMEELFTTAHDLQFAAAATLFGLDYAAPRTEAALIEALRRPLDGVRIVEVKVTRSSSLGWHREAWLAAAAAAEQA